VAVSRVPVQIAFGKAFDLAGMTRAAEQGLGPRHAMQALAAALGARLRMPGGARPALRDHLLAGVAGSAASWTLARALAREVGAGELVYCTDERIGIPVAALCGSRRPRPGIALFVHNLDRPRGRLAGRLFRLARRADLFVTCASAQAAFLRRLGVPESRILLLLEHVDGRFFTPGPAAPGKTRPLIAGVGLERRDYRTLAAATHDLPVDVRISGFSRYAREAERSLPDPLPANMSRRFYEWPELVQLYRDADVVAAPLFASPYAAGVTTLMEGLACARPVVATRTDGLRDYLAPSDGLSLVEPGDAAGLRRAILRLLEHPAEAEAQGRAGLALARRKYDLDAYVARLSATLAAL
jgi:glycosyltransferase involved in cell wall biosynthesis